ncbi:MAG TPA: lactate utilization protein [Bauldia sp.]|nr:lactate utilization protein [Bauldia sp.]
MSARDEILGRIRRSLGVNGREAGRRAIVIARLAGAPKGVIPKRAQLPHADQVALFRTMAEKSYATVASVAGIGDVAAEVAGFLRAHNLPASVRMGADPLLSEVSFANTSIEVRRGPSDGNDETGLSRAAHGIAETGTLILTSGPENPSTVNFLPANHVVVVRAEDVLGDAETAFAALRARYGKGLLPRTVNMVTGPSRSGDIEQTMLFGAHGPKRLHIIVVG